MSEERPVRSLHADPWSKPIPEGPWDVIVIGSGMGGMTTAALLTKLGRRVLVLEQHYTAGGFTHTFKRPGYTWDVGVHAVGEVTRHAMPGRVLAALTDDHLQWASLGPVYDEFHYPGDLRLDFPDRPETFLQNLDAAFPGEGRALSTWMGLVRDVVAGMKGYYLSRLLPAALSDVAEGVMARGVRKYLSTTTAEVLKGVTGDERLRTALTAQWGYYGSPPSRSSFAIQALVTKHFLYGGYYPVGGSREIARTLLGTVKAGGGATAIRADVAAILVEGGRAVGVRLGDGRELRARAVVSAAGVASTVNRLLPAEVASTAWAGAVRDLAPAPAHVCLYLGFKGDIRAAGASGANKWFYEVWSSEAEAWEPRPGEDLPAAPVLYCSFPSLKDPRHDPGPEQRHTGEVVTFVPWETFAPWQGSRWKKRPEDYEAFKAAMAARLLDQLLSHMPGLRGMVDHVELSTPLSTDNFCRPMAGSIYGIEPTPTRFKTRWLRPRSPLPGLYFSGSEVATVGVIGAMMGGVLAAVAVEPVAALRYLKEVG